MSAPALTQVLDAQIACVEEGGGQALGLKASVPLIEMALPEKHSDFGRLAQTTLCTPYEQAASGEVTNLQTAREVAAFLHLLRAMDARRADQELLDRLIDVLSSAPDMATAAFASALNRTIDADHADRARRAEELAAKKQMERDRIQRFVARFRTAPAHRAGLDDVLNEMRAMKSALSATCWRAIAEEIAGGALRSQEDAEASLKRWIDLNARWSEAGELTDRNTRA
ncbi:MAG: hypothetical protein AAF661_00860 [Pseudomonadota bacterium]